MLGLRSHCEGGDIVSSVRVRVHSERQCSARSSHDGRQGAEFLGQSGVSLESYGWRGRVRPKAAQQGRSRYLTRERPRCGGRARELPGCRARRGGQDPTGTGGSGSGACLPGSCKG